jgi:phage baseplate assembly protein W
MADVPHLQWPLRIHDGRLQVVEQDTIEDVRQCVHALLVTPRGARPLAPELGIDDPTFIGVDPERLAADLQDAEPRAIVTVELAGPDQHGQQQVPVHVELADAGEPE